MKILRTGEKGIYPMKQDSVLARGFSLIELMVVVCIIGIFAALTVPGILEILYRNSLADSVERVRSVAQLTRDLAMQTRNGVVMEVRADRMWINILNGPSCSDGIQNRCVGTLADSTGTVRLFDAGGTGAKAGIIPCGGFALTANTNSVCNVTTALNVTTGFALCYSGRGELWFRPAADANTVCTATAAPNNTPGFSPTCSVDPATGLADVTFISSDTTSLTEGAVLMINRFDGNNCTADAIDVMRMVTFPTNGAPFSKLP